MNKIKVLPNPSSVGEFSSLSPEEYKVADDITTKISSVVLDPHWQEKYWAFTTKFLNQELISKIKSWCEARGTRFYSSRLEGDTWMLGVRPPGEKEQGKK